MCPTMTYVHLQTVVRNVLPMLQCFSFFQACETGSRNVERLVRLSDLLIIFLFRDKKVV